MPEITNLIQASSALITALAWPLLIGFTLWYLREPIRSHLRNANVITAKVFGQEVSIQASNPELARETKKLLDNLQETLQEGLKPDMVKLFYRIRENKNITVGEIYPNFQRESKDSKGESYELSLFRGLRDRQLIHPFEGGRWEKWKHPIVTQFAEIVLKICPDCLTRSSAK